MPAGPGVIELQEEVRPRRVGAEAALPVPEACEAYGRLRGALLEAHPSSARAPNCDRTSLFPQAAAIPEVPSWPGLGHVSIWRVGEETP